MMRLIRKICSAFIVVGLISSTAHADEVVDWNQTMLRAAFVAGTSPLVVTRVGAIVQAAVFDAVNGIDRRYTPIHVPPAGPAAASRDAAAAQATYATLVQLYPTFRSFSSALKEVKNARIYAGIHFRSATDDGQVLGESVGQYVLEHAAQRLDR